MIDEVEFSIITPTHNPEFLVDAYLTMMDQDPRVTWEWIIGLNGRKGALKNVPQELKDDKRIKFIHIHGNNIGELKAKTCAEAKGTWLVELDHDDMLAPTALASLSKAGSEPRGKDQKTPDFMYSKWVEFLEEPDESGNVFHTYGEYYGWKSEEQVIEWLSDYDLPMTAPVTIPHEITPSSLNSILYAPNHVRVWRRSFYESIGGHNPSLLVCDDYDLVCRSYIAKGEFRFVDEVLYAYRMRKDGNNSFLIHNDKIQQESLRLSNEYFFPIAETWAIENELPMLDMGGAHNKMRGLWTAVDMNLPEGADGIKANIMKDGLPFGDNTVGLIRAQDFLEHIPRCKTSGCTHDNMVENGVECPCTVSVMNEFYRVLVPGGVLITATPSTDGRGAFQDPTHVSFWNSNSFWYYTQAEHASYIRNEEGCKFQPIYRYDGFPNDHCKLHNIVYTYCNLVALKGQYQPGRCEI